MGDMDADGHDEDAQPVWLVRTVLLLFLIGFGIFLTFEVLDFAQGP